MNRDELARHLYIHDPAGAPAFWQVAATQEWDLGKARPEDVADCYARADRMIANGEVPGE